MSEPALIFQALGGNAPANVSLANGVDMQVVSIVATYDGSSAGGSFLPVLSVYSQEGKLMGRYPATSEIVTGNTALVTYGPGLSEAGQLERAKTYHKISAASTNAANVVASSASLVGYYIVNTSAAFSYVKLYNTASTPTAGSGTPQVVLGIPAASAANVSLANPAEFTSGIGVTTVTGIADSDATAVAANDLAITLYYV